MRASLCRLPVRWILIASTISGCGYSQDEWDHKVRENDEFRDKLAAEKRSRTKAESDYADALEEIDALRAQVSERGTTLDSMTASYEAQQQALAEYEQRAASLLEMQERFDGVRDKLQELTKLGLTVEVRDNHMVIRLPGDVLFDSGLDRLKKEGEDIVLQVANAIRSDIKLSTREFQVAGHTDNRDFADEPFKDNWGLSAMRARSVLMLLIQPKAEGGAGFEPSRWSAAGYGATNPVASNDTEDGRRQNRRVELVAQPEVGEMLNLGSLVENSSETQTDSDAASKPASKETPEAAENNSSASP